MGKAWQAWVRLAAGGRAHDGPGAAGPRLTAGAALGTMIVSMITASRAFGAAVAVLAGIASVRLLRHAMWRDEVHAFAVAAASATLPDLVRALDYEVHPGLWYLLLWVLARLAAGPQAMQYLQLAIGLGTWWLLLRCSPFSRVERLLLLASYFLFWEYFVLARMYGLGALLGFAALALRERAAPASPLPWAALGLLANTSVFGCLWSFGIAAGWLARDGMPVRRDAVATATYLLLLIGAVYTMKPAPDWHYRPPDPPRDMGPLAEAAAYPRGALLPPTLTRPFEQRLAPASAAAAKAPSEPTAAPVALARRVGWLALPLVAVPFLLRARAATIAFLVTYAGTVAFATAFGVPGYARHHGILFLALVGAAWQARREGGPLARPSWGWLLVLAVGALGGLASLSIDQRPFSRAGDVAAWLRHEGLADRFLIGWRDMPVSGVAGQLGRPLYHLECECRRLHVVWDTSRVDVVDAADLAARLLRGLDRAPGREAIVILSAPRTLDPVLPLPGVHVERLAAFSGAVVPEENFTVYRLRPADGAQGKGGGDAVR